MAMAARSESDVKDGYSVRLYMNSSVVGGPFSRDVFCVVPYHPLYLDHLEDSLEEMEPEMKTNADYTEEPVEFDDTSTEAAVTLELPSETPGYKIIPVQESLKIHKKQVDDMFQSCTNPPPYFNLPKLALYVCPEGDSVASSTSWSLNVLGLEEELSFTLTFPSLSAGGEDVHSATTPFPEASEDHLTAEDFRLVKAALWDIRYRWFLIGLGLSFDPALLKKIEFKYGGNVGAKCLAELVDEWLKRAEPKATWGTLVSALREPAIGEEEIAEDIAKMYPFIPYQRPPSEIPQPPELAGGHRIARARYYIRHLIARFQHRICHRTAREVETGEEEIAYSHRIAREVETGEEEIAYRVCERSPSPTYERRLSSESPQLFEEGYHLTAIYDGSPIHDESTAYSDDLYTVKVGPKPPGSLPWDAPLMVHDSTVYSDDSHYTVKVGPKPPDYCARLYTNSPVPGGPCTRLLFCIVPCDPRYTQNLEAYLKKKEPEMNTSAEHIEQPVEFEDTNTKPAVTLKYSSETPGCKIISPKNPLTIYKKQLDHVFQNRNIQRLPDDYPKKLALNVSPECDSSSNTWDLSVVGLKEELSFTLRFPSTRGQNSGVESSIHSRLSGQDSDEDNTIPSRLTQMPDLNDLTYLEGSAGKAFVKIIDQVQARWQTLAAYFQLPPETPGNIRAMPNFEPQMACREVFHIWLNGGTKEYRQPKEWITVIQAIERVLDNQPLADKIREVLNA